MNIKLKQDAIVVFVGSIGVGKSTFAKKHFAKHNIVETDFIREQLTGDFENQDYNNATFKILYATVEARAKAGIFTVVDSTGSKRMIDEIDLIADINNRPLYIIKFPFLEESQITEERMKHRMKYMDVYYRMKERIENTEFPFNAIVYDIEDIDDVDISFENYNDEYRLNPNYKYVIVPDLHGEYTVLEHHINKHNDPSIKFVCLGDFVDRGASSYKTFQLLKNLCDSGKFFTVHGNHDNKLYRYFKKWLNDDKNKFDPTYHYNMKIAHGLGKTLEEFYGMKYKDMLSYATDFISFYDFSKPYLFMERDDAVHYFTHAGISDGIANGSKLNKRDISAAMYETITDPEDLTDLFKNEKKKVILHVGHEYSSDIIDLIPNYDKTRWIFKHDVGLGKIDLTIIPEFMVL